MKFGLSCVITLFALALVACNTEPPYEDTINQVLEWENKAIEFDKRLYIDALERDTTSAIRVYDDGDFVEISYDVGPKRPDRTWVYDLREVEYNRYGNSEDIVNPEPDYEEKKGEVVE